MCLIGFSGRKRRGKQTGYELERITGSQVQLGEENRVPGVVVVILEKVNPKAIIGDQQSPGSANATQLDGVLGPHQLDNLHQNI